MSTVLAMRLNRDQAILIADESTWHLGHVFGYRRTNYGDAIATLVEADRAEASGLTAVYAGVGFPSLHDEVARRLRRELAELAPGDAPRLNKEVAARAYEAFLAGHHRLVDDKLRFDFGFSLAELNARRTAEGGDIQQASVVAAARATANGSIGGNAATRIFASHGFLVGRDEEHGIQGWYLSPQGCQMGFATPLAVLGDGDSIASARMAEFLERRDLPRRREGFGTRDGLYIALRIASELHERVGTMGGYLQILLVDGAATREVVTHASRLADEVMRAHRWGFLSRGQAQDLVASLVLDGAATDAVEPEMFRHAGRHAGRLERYLAGFKPAGSPLADAEDPHPSFPKMAAHHAAPPKKKVRPRKRPATPRKKSSRKVGAKAATRRPGKSTGKGRRK
jgi:hypothetical protein